MTKKVRKLFHTGSIKKTIFIKSTKEKVWRKISNIAGLPTWALNVKKTIYLSKKRKGIGAIRKITFNDGSIIEEHIVAWKKGECFTYVATDGLPLRAYVAIISIKPINKKTTKLTWESYLNSKKMSSTQFKDFLSSLESFYEKSLENLITTLEKQH
jgi:Polyketide cyclase / dehydrase and lipid transport